MIFRADKMAMLGIINTILKNPDMQYCELDLMGSIHINGGSHKKQGKKTKNYQFIKGELALCHDAIKENDKNNIAVIQDCIIPKMALMPKWGMSDMAKEIIEKESENEKQFLEKHPKIAKALDNLIKALEEEGSK